MKNFTPILAILAIFMALSHGMNPDHPTAAKQVIREADQEVAKDANQSDQGQSSQPPQKPSQKPSTDRLVVEEFGKLLGDLKAEVEGQIKVAEDRIHEVYQRYENYPGKDELYQLLEQGNFEEFLQKAKAMEEAVGANERVPFELEKPRQKLADLAQFLTAQFGAQIAKQILKVQSFDNKFIQVLMVNNGELNLEGLELKRNALKKELAEMVKKFREHYGREAE